MSGSLKATEALAEIALAFLKEQRLPPTPQNYTLAYLAKSGSVPEIEREVARITDGGVRMTQDEADSLGSLHVGGARAPGAVVEDDGRAAVRQQTLRLAEMAADAAAATGDFNRDLSAGFVQLDGGAADVQKIVGEMIERSRRAERELAETAREVETLRQELDSARDDATKDALTGLANRRAIDAQLAQLAHEGTPRLLAICDVDHFKLVNDRYGHAIGDRVLTAIADALSEACAPHSVGRWGGEEFLVVMPETGIEEGRALLDTVRKRLGRRNFKLRETDEPIGAITFSAGMALATGDGRENVTALSRADSFLYRAKAEGRNRIIAG